MTSSEDRLGGDAPGPHSRYAPAGRSNAGGSMMRLRFAGAVVVGAMALAGCIRFGPATSVATSDTPTAHATSLVTGDFTGDGGDDVLVFGDPAGPVRMDSCGPVCLERHERLDATVSGGFAADVNGDGIDDLVSGSRAFLGGAAGLSRDRTVSFTMPSGADFEYAADFTGDHRVDIVGSRYAFGNSYREYVLARGNGAGGFGAWESRAFTPLEAGGVGSAIGDLDGDGAEELLINFLGHVAVDDPSNSRSFDFPNVPWGHVVTGDIDGDGRDDVGTVTDRLVFFRSTGSDLVAFPPYVPYQVTGSSEFVLRDIDGDGAADLYHRDASGAELWRSGSADGGFPYKASGTPPSLTATDGHRFADIDGDGKLEIVRPDGGGSASISLLPNTSF